MNTVMNTPTELDKYQSAMVLTCKGWAPEGWSEQWLEDLSQIERYNTVTNIEHKLLDYSKILKACSNIMGVDPEHLSIQDYNYWLLKTCRDLRLDVSVVIEKLMGSRQKDFTSFEIFVNLRALLSTLRISDIDIDKKVIYYIFDRELMEKKEN